jgi:hypothetical protein
MGWRFFCDTIRNDACEALSRGVGYDVLLHEYGMTMLDLVLHR